ncbi:uncharacterized protein V1510DRAFT_422290 [Dipodascopsis tothii]|uniref:uncharacterized protein n=1 Tax=Dipodascopsis tothii TaxID=44089 RepID=UPI0034CEE6D1
MADGSANKVETNGARAEAESTANGASKPADGSVDGEKPAAGPQVTPQELLTIFKRRGQFDALRKEFFKEFQGSATHEDLLAEITSQAGAQAESSNRTKTAALVEGAVDRSDASRSVNEYATDHITDNRELAERVQKLMQAIYDEQPGAAKEQ